MNNENIVHKVYTIEFYSGVKKNKIMKFTGKCKKPETIVLSEIIQAQKKQRHVFSLICGFLAPNP